MVLVLVEGLVAADLRLELDELLGHLVRGPLGENPQDGPPCLVHLDTTTQRKPTGTGTLNTYCCLLCGNCNLDVFYRGSIMRLLISFFFLEGL